MMTDARLQVHVHGAWRDAAELRLRAGEGRGSPTHLEYDLDYALAFTGAAGIESLSHRFPVGFALSELKTFPAFTIDLMPQGVPRRRIEGDLKRDGIRPSDWQVLLRGAGSPTGNLRVAQAAYEPDDGAQGLPREAVLQRGDTFAEWAAASGVPMRGATDTTGASPKLLLTEDVQGLLHADGVLPDHRARRHWLVKFPRGPTTRDHQVLACEAPFLELARHLGLRCGEPLEHHTEGVLFVPRFDRLVQKGGVLRLGMESLYSLMGVVEAGAGLRWETACAAVAAAVDEPAPELTELVLRDALSMALGDTDNHGRNTALLKTPDGVRLSPVYDLAPMFLDPGGVTRSSRWASELVPGGVSWQEVVASLSAWVPPATLSARLLELSDALADAIPWLASRGVVGDVLERLTPRLTWTRRALDKLRG